MKLRNIVATSVAAVVAVSAMSVSTFALTTEGYLTNDANNTVYVLADKDGDPNWSVDSGVASTDVYGITYYVDFNADEVADEATWIGGGVGANSQSTGWMSVEWGRNEKPIICDLENGTITWLSDAPIFAADDTYCQFWLQAWGGTITVTGADILGADGAVISTSDEVADEEVADEEVADEEVADEEVADEAEEATDEVADEAEETTEEVADEAVEATEEVTETTTADKASPDTGVEGVAAVAGLAIVAAGAVIIAKNRK